MYRKTANHDYQKPVWILAHDSMQQLALKIVDSCKQWQDKARTVPDWNNHEVRSIEFRKIIQWEKFADGFPNLFIKDVKHMAGKDGTSIAYFNIDCVRHDDLSIMYQLPRYLAHSVTIILPYFPTGTMERIDLEGQIATAVTLATMLSQIPSSARGPTQIMIFDIHALQERFYFHNEVIPRLETAIPLLIRELEPMCQQNADSGNTGQVIRIAFPDDGAQKRFGKLFPEKWEHIVCSKTRVGDRREVKLREGDPKDAHVVLVDDLVQTGGTLIESAQVLLKHGARAVSAFVTHAVFPNESWKKFTSTGGKQSVFTNFWITDSIPHAIDIAAHPPFKLLSLAPVIADSLLGFDLRLVD